MFHLINTYKDLPSVRRYAWPPRNKETYSPRIEPSLKC